MKSGSRQGPALLLFSLLSAAYSIALNAEEAVGARQQQFDMVILNGRVIDPETSLDAIRNIGVSGGKILAVTAEPIEGEQTLDATGKVVAPGFIDLHAHGQSILAGRVQALDGVTTALELEAGLLPVADFYQQAGAEGRPIHYGTSVSWGAARIGEFTGNTPVADLEFFFDSMSEQTWQQEVATEEQLANILDAVQQGLDQGGLGVGVLLGYAPGSGHREYFELNALAAENEVPTFTHARYLSNSEPKSSFEGIQEMIAVSASTGAHLHICHLNSISMRDIEPIALAITEAQRNGVRISTEAYPYGAGATGIGAAMFRGDGWQARMGGISKSDFTLDGVPLTDDEFDRLQAEAPETGIIVHFLNLKERPRDQVLLDMSVLLPGGAIASDGGGWSGKDGMINDDVWPLPETAHSHPRSAGTYSRFLRTYVREQGKITLSEAMAKASLIPAQILEDSVPQMRSKGRLQVGADADIVIFDLDNVSDMATFEVPARPSIGFEYVIVMGTPLVVEGVVDTDVLPGQPVRRHQQKGTQ
jgi:N-acyl-D-glutamate deacylase